MQAPTFLRRWLRSSWIDRLAQLLIALVLLTLFGWVLGRLAPVLTPIFVSLLIAYFLDPLIDRFEEKKVSRTLAMAFVATAALLAGAVFAWVVVPTLAREIGTALTRLPEQVDENWDSLRVMLQERFGRDLDMEATRIAEGLATQAQAAIGGVLQSMLDSVNTLLNLVLVPVFTFYFLRDFDRLKMLPLELVPPRHRTVVLDKASAMDAVVGEWVRGQIQVALILAVLYAVGLGLIGLKLGVFIGLFAGVLNIVPYLGGAIGIGLSLLMALIYGDDPVQMMILVAVVFAVVQGLEGYLITPRLVGEKVGMSPVMVMAVLLVGGSLFGFFGLLLSIPAVAAGTVIARDVFDVYRTSSFFQRDADEDLDGDVASFDPHADNATTDDEAIDGGDTSDDGAGAGDDTSDDDAARPDPAT